VCGGGAPEGGGEVRAGKLVARDDGFVGHVRYQCPQRVEGRATGARFWVAARGILI
jgi:hypothetical protein